jgi:hypothetical protein
MEYFNPHSNQWLLNKFEIYKILRGNESAYFSKKYNAHVITRYSDVKSVLSNHHTFSSAKGNLIVENENRFEMTLGASDDPIHSIYKNIAFAAYSKNNLKRICDTTRVHARQLLNKKGEFNISNIIEEISAWTTAEILNLPYDKEYIKDLILDIQHRSSGCVLENTDDSSTQKISRLISAALIESQPSPGPGIYHEYLNNNPTGATVMSLFIGPCFSGASSLTGSLQFLTLDLYREKQLDALLQDRTLISNAVNESLRFHASTGRFSRTVTKDTVLHNLNLKPGDRVAICLDSANRDPSMFSNPDVFDLYRNTGSHVAFGHGLHACVALTISKEIMTVYLETLLDVVGSYRVVTKNEDLQYVMTSSGNNDMLSNLVVGAI